MLVLTRFFHSTAFAALLLAIPQAHAQSPTGRWITASGNLEVEIAPCGSALCGTVSQVFGNGSMRRASAEMAAADPVSALGMVILKDFVRVDSGDPAAPASAWTGQIYNRENGKTYSCQMWVNSEASEAGELLLHPYVGIPLFGKTQRWRRAPSGAQLK